MTIIHDVLGHGDPLDTRHGTSPPPLDMVLPLLTSAGHRWRPVKLVVTETHTVGKWAVRIILECFLVELSLLNLLLLVALVVSVTLVVALGILPQNFGKVAATYE